METTKQNGLSDSMIQSVLMTTIDTSQTGTDSQKIFCNNAKLEGINTRQWELSNVFFLSFPLKSLGNCKESLFVTEEFMN